MLAAMYSVRAVARRGAVTAMRGMPPVTATVTRGMATAEENLARMGLQLPEIDAPAGNYVFSTQSGNLVFTAGQLPKALDGQVICGTVGADLTLEDGYEAARLCGLQLIAVLKQHTGGDLERVKRIVKVLGFVQCTPDFADQPKVINGASDLFAQVFEERGIHARSAVGTNALPLNIAAEVEAIVELHDE